MSDIEKRINDLEKHTAAGKPDHKTWVVVEGEPLPDGADDGDSVIRVKDEKAKRLTERVLAGERSEQ
ncbi:hypothetical protein ES703_75071 [subsurface metagenome]